MQAMQRAMKSKYRQVEGYGTDWLAGWLPRRMDDEKKNKEHLLQQQEHLYKIKKKNRRKSEIKEAKRFACRSRYKQQPNKIYRVNVRKLYRH